MTKELRAGGSAAMLGRVACVVIVIVSFILPSNASGDAMASSNADSRQYAAVAFDYFVLFNPDSVITEVDRVVPGKARAFVDIWRNRQFEYSWLRSMTRRYIDFFAVTEDALVFAADAMHVRLTDTQRRRLMDAYLHLKPWPDTAAALRRLKAANLRIVTIANFSPLMLRSNAEHAGLSSLFDALISTDENRTYKPDPRAYELGLTRLRLRKQDIVFAAFGGWDAVGAKSFGYPTVWVNRFNQPLEQLTIAPDRVVRDLDGLLTFVLSSPGAKD
jgi:2-haloacid dehalogenase